MDNRDKLILSVILSCSLLVLTGIWVTEWYLSFKFFATAATLFVGAGFVLEKLER